MSEPVRIEVNTAVFVSAIERRFENSKKTWSTFFREQTGLLVKKIALVTPPGKPVKVSQMGETGGSFSSNKKRGEARLRKNIWQIFTTKQNKLNVPGRYLSRAEKQTIVQQNSQLSSMKEVHDRMRNRRGGINSGQSPFFVVEANAIKRYFKYRKQRVGYLAGGWIPAANKLGAKGLPAWIKRHNSPGTVKLTVGFSQVIFEAQNNVGFAGDIDRMQDRIQWACSLATSDLMKQIAKYENRRVRL